MCKLRIKNFGPIRDGCTDLPDGFFPIGALTIFVGNQGAGKSTIAKLFASFVWLEKALIIGKLSKKEVETQAFIKYLLSYHKIYSFLYDDSIIEYRSEYYYIQIREKRIKIKVIHETEFNRPQIQYIPSERNLVAVIDRFAQLPLLPDSMREFLYVYDEVINNAFFNDYILPIENLNIRYNKRRNKIELYSDDYHVYLNEAASGFQSAVPLYMITKYFTDVIQRQGYEYKFKNLLEEKAIITEYNRLNNNSISFHDFFLRKLNTCFYNIVEEPEQNLFPNSQKNIVLFLIECMNSNKNNKLVLTTHSPYVLETINNSIYAESLQRQGKNAEILVPKKHQISYDSVFAYVVKNGEIKSINDSEINQINPNEIDVCSQEINNIYESLTELEFPNED